MTPDLADLAEQTLATIPVLGIALALVAAVLLAFGTQFQNRGVVKVEDSHGTGAKAGLSVRQLLELLRRPSWVIGTVLMGVAIVLQLGSLTVAPITVVQPLGAAALVVTAVLNARLSGVPLDRKSIRAIVICVLGVGAFVTVAAFVTKSRPVTATQLIAVLVILAIALAAFITVFVTLRHRLRPMFYVISAGVLFGFVVTLAKVVIDRIRTIAFTEFEFGPADILTLFCVVGLVAAALLGTYFVQTAHASNPPDLVVAGLTVIDPIVAVSIGIIVLGEAASAPLWAVLAFIATAAVAVYGMLSLARHHPQLQN